MSEHYEGFNYLFETKLNNWTPIRSSLRRFFTEDEIEALDRSNRSFTTAKRKIMILSFENRFAQLGGLGAVMRHFPHYLQEQGEEVFLITPLHLGNSNVKQAIEKGVLIERFSGLEVRICNYSCTIGCFEDTGATLPSFHIEITGRFLAGDNPYGYSDEQELLLDALAFCAVVPSALAKLGHTEHIVFHAHDWETASIAAFARCAVLSGVLQQATTVLTINNAFDAPFPDSFKRLFFNRTFEGCTVLQSMIPFFHGSVTTVSTPYAHELRHDPLQCGFFVDHLQRIFSMNPPLGIENGIFGEPFNPFSEEEIHAAENGDYRPLLIQKTNWRTTLNQMILDEKELISFGTLSREILEDPSIPVFFMSGRLDLMQKGFDTIFHAFKRLKKDRALMFFTPTPCHKNDDLSFFIDIAQECRGNIIIWPTFISSSKYRLLLKGSSFLIMPSFYEPFGAANEGQLNGTPLIARATGGLLAQLKPGKNFQIPALYTHILPKCSDKRNAILFRESFPDDEARKLWVDLLRLPLNMRMENELYRSIVDAAYNALLEAINIFNDQKAYGAMIYDGLQSIHRDGWKTAAEKYRAVFDVSIIRGA